MTSRARSLGAALVGVALLSACGSTAQLSAASTNGGFTPPPGSELGASDLEVATGAGSTATDLGSGSVGQGAGTSSAGQSSRSSQPAPGEARVGNRSVRSPAAAVELGPGVDAKTITIGLMIQSNNATVSSLASAYNVQLANEEGAYEALVKHVNAQGGVAGRQLRPIYHRFDSTSATAAEIGQAACAAFTEDASVFAALDTLSVDTFNACMQQRGRLMLQYGLFVGSRTTWDRYPNVVAAEGLPFNDAGRVLAEHLSRAGFFSPATKVGAIVRSSDDLIEAYRRGFVPALAKSGLTVTEAHFVRDAQSASELSGYTSDISSAVLKFRSENIDRVVFFDTGSYAAMVFSQNAEQQGYRPRYGFSSLNSIVTLQGEGSAAPQEQMVGAQGVSWETAADGLTKERTRSAQRCLAILAEAGIVPQDAGTEGWYLKICQAFFLFKATADRAGHDLNRDSFIGSVEAMGPAFEATNTWGGVTSFGPKDHSGVSVFRPFVYSQECSCFVVDGGAQPVGAS